MPLVALGLLFTSISEKDDQLMTIAILLGLLAILCFIFQCILAARALCPLCRTPVLAAKACAKHRNARTFLGSHRMRVAMGILFRDSFVCPYCHEPSVLEVRQKRQ